MLSPQKIIGRLYTTYIVLFLFFLFIGFSIFPPFHNAAMQLAMWVVGLMISLFAYKKSIKTITVLVFVYQLAFIFITSEINIAQYGDILGFEPHDADFYRSCGEDFGDKPYQTFIIWLVAVFPTVDDWGFPSLMWLLYRTFGSAIALWILRGLNALLIAWGGARLYKIACGYLEKKEANIIALFWGLMPYAVAVGANGLKENIFVFLVISFFYYLYRSPDKSSIGGILGILLYGSSLFLFRLATGYAAIICVLTWYLLKKRNIQKNFALLLTIGIGAAVVLFPFVLNYITLQRGYESDFFGDRNDAKAESVGGVIGFIVNTLSSFIGPIPCFVSSDTDKLQYLTFYSFTPLVKILTSFFFYYSFIDIIKKRRFQLMPMAVFSIINILLLIVAFFGLHVRMHWPHMPLFLIMAYWGYKKYAESKHKVPWYPLYLGFTFLLIMFYNFR